MEQDHTVWQRDSFDMSILDTTHLEDRKRHGAAWTESEAGALVA